jgi:8-oxo-dGTP diphosphatase
MWVLNAHFIVGTVVIIRDIEGRVLIARHTYRRHSPWALPGGWVQRGEDPAETVVREIREETGLVIEILGPLTIQRESPWHLTVVYGGRSIAGIFEPTVEVSELRCVVPGEWPAGMRADHCELIAMFSDHPMFRERGA